MAFSTTVVRNGVEGDFKVIWGTWSGSASDTPGSLVLGAGYIRDAEFLPNLSSGPSERVNVSGLGTSGSGTLTVYNHQDVTSGSFKVSFR